MKLSINGRVVKCQDVEVSTPRLVECNEGFQRLEEYLSVLTVGEDVSTVHPDWVETETSSLMSEAQEKAEEILAEAQATAQEIREKAQADARKILAEAQEEMDRLREEVTRTAQAEIYPSAQAEGYRIGLEAGEAEGKRLTQNANQLFQLAQRAVQEEYAKVDTELLHLAIKIAERLVRSSLAVAPQRLMNIIRSLTLLPQEQQGWRLHVASEDAHLLEGDHTPCPWVIDESLGSGDCYLECQEGIFDARMEAQLNKLENALREELEHGSMEFVGSDSGTN
ncbi:FliH/SctL family protein [Desulfosporosinus sp. SB140]|uniref:FliH/SctL family protein n=1 Tax=Desulfosporosinus paludis TaxID=3115649 RepID=UPI00389090A2